MRETISTQIKKLENTSRLKTSVTGLEDNGSFQESSEGRLKSTLASAATESSQLEQSFEDVRAAVADLQERLGPREVVIWPIAEDSYVTLGQSLRSLVDNFRACLNMSVSGAFLAGSIRSQFHVDAATDSITLRVLEGVELDDDDN